MNFETQELESKDLMSPKTVRDKSSHEGKKVHFVSLGCPKNLVDTEVMLATLKNDGYEVVEDAQQAQTIVVNTCGFIEDSKKESIDKILEMAELKKKGQLQDLVVAGCLTQRYKNDLVEGLPEADLFVGSGEFQNISQILKNKEKGETRKDFFHLPTYLQTDQTPRHNSQPRHRAYLKISEGCKKRCAFCSIPHIRGNLQSRSLDVVVSEAKLLVAGGAKELNVISHDFTDYGWDLRRKDPERKENSYELLKALSDQSGADWIRVLYLYPDGLLPQTVELIGSRPNLVNYFDMPLQHINSEVLKRMNRRMTRSEIEDVLFKIREKVPGAVIRTQFIVGFPGETEEQFEELLEFVKEFKFDRVGCFQYSPQEGTKGASLDNPVDEETKQNRFDRLMQAQQEISYQKHRDLIGQTLDVIVEGYSEETELLLKGRSSQQAPDIDGVTYISSGQANVGDLVKVRITDAHHYDLVGEIQEPDSLS